MQLGQHRVRPPTRGSQTDARRVSIQRSTIDPKKIYGKPWSGCVIKRRLSNHHRSQGIQQNHCGDVCGPKLLRPHLADYEPRLSPSGGGITISIALDPLRRRSQFGDRFHLRNIGAPPTTRLGAACSSVVLAALPHLDSLKDGAKRVASRAYSWSVAVFKCGTTSWRTFCRAGDPLYHGHTGIDHDVLFVAESQRGESIQSAWPNIFEILKRLTLLPLIQRKHQ